MHRQGGGAYPGNGTAQACALNDPRWLQQDGTRTGYLAWIIQGGDTVILRGSIADGVTYRIGWNNPYSSDDTSKTGFWYGYDGDAFSSGLMPPPSGPDAQHPTRILGGNYGACTDSKAKTQLHGGFAANNVISLAGSQNVEVQCLDLTDFAYCSKDGVAPYCNSNSQPFSDFARNGLLFSKSTSNVLVQDVAIHGLAADGVRGATGPNVKFNRVSVRGNSDGGWNSDDGTVGSGTTTWNNFDISWNGCTEEYPQVHPLPYDACADGSSGGYGDGVGTRTQTNTVDWHLVFDTGVVSYNTQDGLDTLHLVGAGSSMTINRVLAYGNQGQQIKVGGSGGVATNNLLVGNCYALKYLTIPGTPAGLGSSLSEPCRANNTVLMTVQPGSVTTFENNTIYGAGNVGVEVSCDPTTTCDGTEKAIYRNNLFIGFPHDEGGAQVYAQAVYPDDNLAGIFTRPGSAFDHNLTFHNKGTIPCPWTSAGETNGLCSDPRLVNETVDVAYGNMAPVSGSPAIRAGVFVAGVTTDFTGAPRPSMPTIGALEPGSTYPLPMPVVAEQIKRLWGALLSFGAFIHN